MTNLPHQLKRDITRHQPAWVCLPCAKKYGQTPREGVTSWHDGDQCGVCGEFSITTEPRDFGYLKQGWQSEALAKTTGRTLVSIPVNPDDAMLKAMEEAYMPFGDMAAVYDAIIGEVCRK